MVAMRVQVVRLQLQNPWRIAHGVSTERSTVIVERNGGYGEAAIVPYLGESSAEILAAIDSLGLNNVNDHDAEVRGDVTRPLASRGAQCALDLASLDAEAQIRGEPLWKVLGVNAAAPIETSFTIAMDTPDEMAARARAADASILKLKMGGVDDEACVEAVRGVTNARLWLDANGGWSREQAAFLIPRLTRFKIELVEQPLAGKDRDGFAWLRAQHVGVPIFADESVSEMKDIDSLADSVDGVVIKLRKFGGVRPALAAIERARTLGLRTMMGCMIESSLAVTAAAHLALRCDLADLDAPLLIRNDPFSGLTYHGSAVHLPSGAGIGAVPRG
jgi:L-alanine-DL-glutamate epimerase-like enolase superfamily enzyme